MSKRNANEIVLRLRMIRRMQDVTHRELAARSGYHAVSFSRWENGRAVPNLEHVIDWADALGYELTIKAKGEE